MKAELGCDRISDAREACCAVMFHFSLPPDGPLQIFFRISGFQLSGPPHPRSGIPKAPDASDDPSPGCCPEILAAHSRRRGVECVGSDREFRKLLRGDPHVQRTQLDETDGYCSGKQELREHSGSLSM